MQESPYFSRGENVKHSFGSNNWERVAYEPRVTGRDAKIPALDEETPTLLLILGVDTTTGQLKCIRDIMLRGKIVKELHELSQKHLADESISGDFFANNLRLTLTQYHTTEEMIHKVGFENLYMCAANTL